MCADADQGHQGLGAGGCSYEIPGTETGEAQTLNMCAACAEPG